MSRNIARPWALLEHARHLDDACSDCGLADAGELASLKAAENLFVVALQAGREIGGGCAATGLCSNCDNITVFWHRPGRRVDRLAFEPLDAAMDLAKTLGQGFRVVK